MSYRPVTTDEVRRLLSHVPNKQCSLDPVPTWLLKALTNTVPDIIARLINVSLQSGIFPSSQQHALVKPVLKKPQLDPTDPNNYRPISNLSFLSKLLERTVASRLTEYLEHNKLMPVNQSAYRRRHSTETALLKICNDALIAADRGMVTLVVLLDYSAAFDTVDHGVMLDVLKYRFGLTGSALQWHSNYLSGRSFAVVSAGETSTSINLECSLPQGSSLGPLKFILYASELHDLTGRYGVGMHGFADDTQLFRHLFLCDISSAKRDMLAAIADISQWSFAHKLKLNPDKSEVIWLGSRQQLAKLSEADKSLQLPDGLVRSSTTVKNLGVVIDERLSFDDQARSCIKSCYFHLRRLKQIRRYVEPDVIHSLVHAFVTSHLDYCNGLFAGCNAYTVRRLQRVQNTAARLVLDVPHSSPSQPLLRELHWLPIESRIKFKLCVLIYRVSRGTAPLYLCELCKPCTDSRLRSKSRGDFITPRTRLRFTDRAFAVSAPSAWNSLPIDIRDCSSEATFKKHLKTFLFHVAFN